MATIANLAVSVTARMGKYNKGMKGGIFSTRRFGKAISRSAIRVAKWAAITSGVAAAAFVVFTKKAFTAIDALAKMGDRLGIATDRLAGLNLAARLTGVKVEALQIGIQRMVRRVSEAAIGTGEAQGALKEFGLEVKSLSKLSADKIFLKITEAFGKLTDQSTAIRLTFKVFDSEGVSLVNTMALGVDTIEAIIAKTVQYGTAVKRVDAAKVEAAVNVWTEMKEVLSGIFTQIAVNLAPALENLGNRILNIAQNGRSVGELVSLSFERVLNVIEAVTISTKIAGLELKRLALIAAVPLLGRNAFITRGIAVIDKQIRKLDASTGKLRETYRQLVRDFEAGFKGGGRGGAGLFGQGGGAAASATQRLGSFLETTSQRFLGRAGAQRVTKVTDDANVETNRILRQMLTGRRGRPVFGN